MFWFRKSILSKPIPKAREIIFSIFFFNEVELDFLTADLNFYTLVKKDFS